MRKPSPVFQEIIFALLIVWFLLLASSFFITNPVTIITLLPDLLLLGVIILAAYGIGSYTLEIMRINDVLPTEDFVLSTALGLGGLSFLTTLVALLGLLQWWTIAIGLTLAVLTGFSRIIGLVTPPAYLFGPEDLGEEAPNPLSWLQYIVIAVWVVALFHFCLLPPVARESLINALGQPSQWVLGATLVPGGGTPPESVSTTTGLYAMALSLRGPHLAMMLSALLGGLVLAGLYSGAKRYCGPVAARSAFLIAASLPLFSYLLLAPGDGMLLALFQYCAFFCLMRWFDERRRRWALVAGMCIGLSLTVSAHAVFFLPPLLTAILIWAVVKQVTRRILLHLLITITAALLCLIPWLLIHTYLFGNATSWFAPLFNLHPPPLMEGQRLLLYLPFKISFPLGDEPVWRVVGPIFLVFIPFYFFTIRKNFVSGLALAVGLTMLGFGQPFGLDLELRLISLLLLAVPAALAAHRLAEKGWKRKTALGMLYILIFWQIFHATAVVEGIFSSPHRYLLGLENDDTYLERTVDYYPSARWINENLPADSRLLVLGQVGLLYLERRATPATGELQQEVMELFLNGNDIENGVAELRELGYTHILIDYHLQHPGVAQRRSNLESSEQLRLIADNLEYRKIHQDNGIDLISLESRPAEADAQSQ